jgi:hypothetical protein
MLKAGEVRLPRARRMTLAGLTFVTFFTTCGGAFGIEPLVGAVGPGWAVVLLFVTPQAHRAFDYIDIRRSFPMYAHRFPPMPWSLCSS